MCRRMLLTALLLTIEVLLAPSAAQVETSNHKSFPPRIPRQNPLKRSLATGRSAQGAIENGAEILETGSNGFASVDPQNCNAEYEVQDDVPVLVYTSFRPKDKKCHQNFTAKEKDSRLELDWLDFHLRINCVVESLTIETNNTVIKVCGEDEIPSISGPFLNLTYERKIFGIHGGYLATITAVSEAKSDDVTNNTPSDFVECNSCGVNEKSSSTASRTVPGTRIVNGEDAKRSDHPWMVYLDIKNYDVVYSCGGNLITSTLVLTAAHCLDMKGPISLQVGLGINDIRAREEGAIWRTTTNFTLHEDYDPYEIVNDIAVVNIGTPVEFNEYIRPICLPSNSLGDLAGITAIATGWGLLSYGTGDTSNILQEVKLRVWSGQQCSEKWLGFAGVSIPQSQICAYADDKDTCSGDSGGPLVVQLESRWILAGITSFGYECATDGLPGVYTRVSSFVPWIRGFIAEGDCEA